MEAYTKPTFTEQQIGKTMTTENITPEKVQELYSKYHNKQHFLMIFGTKKFHIVDVVFLKRMYDYLIKKTK